MKTKIAIFLISMVISNAGCAKGSGDFQMTVERVDELKGVILKGIAISGPIKSGCIANENEYSVTRDGKEILKTSARILDVEKAGGAKYAGDGLAAKGDKVHLYIPDRHAGDVNLGDVVSSSTTSCGK